MLVETAQRYLQGLLEVAPAEAGMHLVGWLPQKTSDMVASEKALLTAWKLHRLQRTAQTARAAACSRLCGGERPTNQNWSSTPGQPRLNSE